MLHYSLLQKNHPNMSTTAFCVLCAITDRMVYMRQNGCQYAIQELADLTGVSKRRINRELNSLIDEGLILRYKLGRENWYEVPPELFSRLNKPIHTKRGVISRKQIETASKVKK